MSWNRVNTNVNDLNVLNKLTIFNRIWINISKLMMIDPWSQILVEILCLMICPQSGLMATGQHIESLKVVNLNSPSYWCCVDVCGEFQPIWMLARSKCASCSWCEHMRFEKYLTKHCTECSKVRLWYLLSKFYVAYCDEC